MSIMLFCKGYLLCSVNLLCAPLTENITLWLRVLIPGLTSQRHSALISSDSEYFQVCFSAVHYLKISEQRWKRKFSELKISAETALIQSWTALIFSETALIQSWTALIFSETALNSADFWIIQIAKYLLILLFFQNFSKYLNFEAHNSGFQPSLRKEVSNKNLLLHFRTGQSYNTYLNFWVNCYCSSNKTDMVQLFRNIFAFIGVKIQDYSKKFESLLSICRIFTFSIKQEYHFNDHFVRFQHFGLRYRILIVSSTCSSVQLWKSNVSELKKSALNNADSELFLSETALFSSETALNFSFLNSADSENIRADQLGNRADQRWCLSYSLNQRWKTSKLWNSAVQRWLPLGLQPGS